MESKVNVLISTLTILLLLTAVISDVRSARIPNALTYGAIIMGIALNTVLGGAHGAAMALEGMAAGAGLLLLPFILGGMGGGDVKLMAAVGAMMGPLFALVTFLVGAIVGGLVAVARLFVVPGERVAAASRLRSDISLLYLGIMPNPDPERRGFPYAVCIAAGAAGAAILPAIPGLLK